MNLICELGDLGRVVEAKSITKRLPSRVRATVRVIVYIVYISRSTYFLNNLIA